MTCNIKLNRFYKGYSKQDVPIRIRLVRENVSLYTAGNHVQLLNNALSTQAIFESHHLDKRRMDKIV